MLCSWRLLPRARLLAAFSACGLGLAGGLGRAASIQDFDIVIYGGTSGGVTAAVQAARMGKDVALLVFNNHLGGMSSGGLGQTDYGNKDSVQGLARDFYLRVARTYNPAAGGPQWTFEPKVAEAVFNEIAQEAQVPVYFNQRLLGVEMAGNRIAALTMQNGNVFRARMFIDCTYEGDLMAKAGVTYTVGREPNAQYGETLSGIQTARAGGNQLPNGIDPYIVPGDPSSGLLPGVNPGPGGADGSGDTRVQAYCYRMCLTSNPANRIMIAKPEGYNEADYEILFRAIEAGQTGGFWKTDAMPNSKTDSNNASGISCDFIGGGSDAWAEADDATREAIAKAHERWQRGLVWTVQNHPRVPETIRSAWSKWGLPADEFLDTGHWPHQLYVREARRMVSDYVMLQQNCQGTRVAPDSIALASYTMDSHNVQRHVKNGMVKNEGDVQVGVPHPYPISYRSIVPRVGECENLLVTFALSASHMGFGSCRMEPVLMMTSQSAATAACFAIDGAVSVQEVPYEKLKAQLLADGQMLAWGAAAAPGDLILDNTDAAAVTLAGDWPASSSVAGHYGIDYLHDNHAEKGAKFVRFQPTFPNAGIYEVFASWTAHGNRATNVPVDILHAEGTATVMVNQQEQGGAWVSLGFYRFEAGSSGGVVVRNAGTNGYVVADAVRFAGTPTVSLWATNSSAAEPAGSSAPAKAGRVTVSRGTAGGSDLTVSVAIGGTASEGTDYSAASTSVTIPAGAAAITIPFLPHADTLAEDNETITITLLEGAGYTLGALNTATIVLADRPFDAWRKSRFTAQQLADPGQSGDVADADGDGLSTLEEFIFGRDPLAADGGIRGFIGRAEGEEDPIYTFTRAKAADILVIPEISSNLVDWASGASVLGETILADDGHTQTIAVRDLAPPPLPDARFIRLRIQRAP